MPPGRSLLAAIFDCLLEAVSDHQVPLVHVDTRQGTVEDGHPPFPRIAARSGAVCFREHRSRYSGMDAAALAR
jgi:hypothetical protein